jgi:diaminopimelate decarboxylase
MNAANDPATLARAHAFLNRAAPASRAFWFYDLDAVSARAAQLVTALVPLQPRIAYALKANGLPAIARTLREAGLHADAGSLGELELAAACGYDAAHRTLSGNGRTPEEAAWVAAHGVVAVSADTPDELGLLEAEAARAGARVRVALRVNPGIVAGAHRHIATGHSASKFGMSAAQALAAWQARARWPHLVVDGVHLHVGSQIDSGEPLLATARAALELAAESARRGSPLASVNLGGGFGVDYAGGGEGLDLASHARAIAALPGARSLEWCFEPGRWLVAGAGTLVAEVLWDKRRDDAEGEHRFVVLAAGMNDLLRPALYGARHRIVALGAASGAHASGGAPLTPADVVGPVCESSDCFATAVPLPPLERGALVAILDAGAYGAAMSSNYNGRGRLAELVHVKGELRLARPPESPRTS